MFNMFSKKKPASTLDTKAAADQIASTMIAHGFDELMYDSVADMLTDEMRDRHGPFQEFIRDNLVTQDQEYEIEDEVQAILAYRLSEMLNQIADIKSADTAS